jgi:hypothetical protein
MPCIQVYNEKPRLSTGLFVFFVQLAGQSAVDVAEGVADAGSEQAHNGNHDDGDESEDDRILNQTLTFFFGGE